MKGNLFDTASVLKMAEVHIDGGIILPENIIEIEIQWNHDSFEIQAIITLKDNTDLAKVLKNWDRIVVNIFITDMSDNTMSRDFYISKLSETRGDEENTKNLEIKLVDKISFTLKNTFYSKSYSNMSITDIIDDVWKEKNFDKLYDSKFISKKFSKTKNVYDGFVIPQDRSLYEVFSLYLANEGFVWFQNKDSIEIKSVQEILPSVLTADKAKDFLEETDNPNYIYKILDFTGNYVNLYESLKLPASTTYFYVYDEKIMNTIEANLSDVYDSLKTTPASEKYIQPTDGKRFVSIEKEQNCDQQLLLTYLQYMKNTQIEIFVPGNVKGNKLFDKRNASFKGSSLHNEGLTQGNTSLQGEFLVFSIYDKILGEKMISKVNICRLNNTAEASKSAEATTAANSTPVEVPPAKAPVVPPADTVVPVPVPDGKTLVAAAVPEVAVPDGAAVASSITAQASVMNDAAINTSAVSLATAGASGLAGIASAALGSAQGTLTTALNDLAAGKPLDINSLKSTVASDIATAKNAVSAPVLDNLKGISPRVGPYIGDNFTLSSVDPKLLLTSLTADVIINGTPAEITNLNNMIGTSKSGMDSYKTSMDSASTAMTSQTNVLNLTSQEMTSTGTDIEGLNNEQTVAYMDSIPVTKPRVANAMLMTSYVSPVTLVDVAA